jgi:XRE family transcriptional regulator
MGLGVIRMPIGENIKRLRIMHGLSQKELAQIAGVSDKAVSTWENGTKEPRMGAVQKIADHFGLKKSNLIEDNGLEINITPVQSPTPASDDLPDLTQKDEREITHMMDEMKEKLMQEEGLMFDGQPASPESIQSILDAMQIGMEMAKKRNKAKYTPKKYRHED